MPIISEDDGGSGGAAVFAQVHRAVAIADWDGNALPFDVVDTDPLGLWDAVNFAFVPQAAGWYQLAAFPAGSSGARRAAVASTASFTLTVSVNGAGNNIVASVGQHTAVVDGFYYWPAVIGYTHLDVGDSTDVQGPVGAGTLIPASFAFTILLVRPD